VIEVTREVIVEVPVETYVAYEVTRVIPATPIIDQQILAVDEEGLGVQFTDGIWMVGVQIARGVYVNSGGVVITEEDGRLDFECGWKVNRRLTSVYGDTRIYDYDAAHNLVELIVGDRVFESSGCGIWTRQG
jgi:hypothetical protein